jgi:hypothetical protein
MDDPMLVGGIERVSELPRDRQRQVEREGTVLDGVGQRGASTNSSTSACRPSDSSNP